MRIYNIKYIKNNIISINDIIKITNISNIFTINEIKNKNKFNTIYNNNRYNYCIYLIYNYNNNNTYIGSSINIFNRMSTHFKNGIKNINNINSIYYTMNNINIYILPINKFNKNILINIEKYLIITTSPSINIKYNTRSIKNNYINAKPIIVYNTINNNRYIYINRKNVSIYNNIPLYKIKNKITNINNYIITYTNKPIKFNKLHNARLIKY